MKSQDEINDEAIGYASHNDPKGNVNPEGYSEKQVGLLHGFIDGYQKCQEDMTNVLNEAITHLKNNIENVELFFGYEVANKNSNIKNAKKFIQSLNKKD